MKKIISLVSALIIVILSISATSAYSNYTDIFYYNLMNDIDLSYEDEIKPCFYPEIFKGDPYMWYYYNMLYAHYGNDQTEPEYVVFIAKTCTWNEDAFVSRSVGNCLLINSSISKPYDLAHYVYVPSLQKVYTLEEAYYSEELDISAAMRSGRVGLHRGDMNFDRSCDILDATCIQRHLAGLDLDENIVVSRMNLDSSGDVSILDVTKLQRYIASIDDTL